MKIEEKMSYQAPELEEAKYGAFVAGLSLGGATNEDAANPDDETGN